MEGWLVTNGSEETLLTWLHLSDIHVGAGTAAHRWDQKLVMAQLATDLEKLSQDERTPRPDLVLITGDLGFSGAYLSPDEYDQLGTWLDGIQHVFGLKRSSFHFVPGNHDVDRSIAQDDDHAKDLVNALRRQGKKGNRIEAAIENASDLAVLCNRLNAFRKFQLRYQPASPRGVLDDLCWSRSLSPAGGVNVHLVGLNTALLCQDDHDQGKLRIGKFQIEPLLGSTTPGAELVIALTHHPIEWLADRDDIAGWFRNRVHIHLWGHVHGHANDSLRHGGAEHGCIRVASGAVHTDEKEPAGHGFSIASIVRTAQGMELRVYPFLWNKQNMDFPADQPAIDTRLGYARHPLDWPSESGRPTPPPPRSRPADRALAASRQEPAERDLHQATPPAVQREESLHRIRGKVVKILSCLPRPALASYHASLVSGSGRPATVGSSISDREMAEECAAILCAPDDPLEMINRLHKATAERLTEARRLGRPLTENDVEWQELKKILGLFATCAVSVDSPGIHLTPQGIWSLPVEDIVGVETVVAAQQGNPAHFELEDQDNPRPRGSIPVSRDAFAREEAAESGRSAVPEAGWLPKHQVQAVQEVIYAYLFKKPLQTRADLDRLNDRLETDRADGENWYVAIERGASIGDHPLLNPEVCSLLTASGSLPNLLIIHYGGEVGHGVFIVPEGVLHNRIHRFLKLIHQGRS